MYKPNLVILGTGFAAFSLLKNIDTNSYTTHVVSPRNHFLFTPLLPSTTVGTIEFRSIIEPIRTARMGIEYYQALCSGIDTTAQEVHCENAIDSKQFNLNYDYLVIAVGTVNNTFDVPGVKEHALFLKELSDARRIRQRIIENFERASIPNQSHEERRRLLHSVIVGGGPTGIEFAAELHDFVYQDIRRWFPHVVEDVSITIVEAGQQILNSFDSVLRDYTRKFFARQKIDVKTGTAVERVTEKGITLSDGAELACGLVVWSTGIGPSPLVQALSFPKNQSMRILTDQYLRVRGVPRVYALGDCATTSDTNLPATSQVAQQEGRYLARSLNRIARGRRIIPFSYRHYGMLAYIGSNRALADLERVKGHGFSTWLFWRSTYLTKLVSWKNKMLVVFDWLKTSVFGRDISRF